MRFFTGHTPKIFFALMIVLFAATLFLVKIFSWPRPSAAALQSLPDHSIIEWQLQKQSLLVEIVNQPESIRWGLSGRQTLTTDGMLFILPEPSRPVFWMKDMLFPIDIIWIYRGKVVGTELNAQPAPEGTPDSQLQRFPAPQTVDMILETPAGQHTWK